MGKRAHDIRKTAKALKFATLRAKGLTQVEAWRQCFPDTKVTADDTAYVMASQFANDPLVRLKVSEVLQNASSTAMVTASRYIAQVQDAIDLSVDHKNMTAVMAGLRLIGSAGNVLRENFSMTHDHGLTDKQLFDKLAALRPDLAPMLVNLAAPDTFASPDETKH